jgi:spermidine synthase
MANKPVTAKSYKWLHDEVTPHLVQFHSLNRIVHSDRTPFQSVDIVETEMFGRCLVLDGKIQSSERDEFIYHEALVHPVMLAHPNPKSVFIAGGGEGATLREVLQHKTVQHATMVDIDEKVVDICRRYLPSFHKNSFDDPRSKVVFTDARKYLEETTDRYDIVLIDLVEPLEAGPAYLLYTKEFYQIVKSKLNAGGIMCVQSGASGLANVENYFAIHHTLKTVFSIVRPYQSFVPTFVDLWGFNTASETLDPAVLKAAEIDKRILERLTGTLKAFDGSRFTSSFVLYTYLRRELAQAKRIIVDNDPLYM